MEEVKENHEIDGKEEEEGGEVSVCKPCTRKLLDVLFPLLTQSCGQRKLTRKRSTAILMALYASHVFSAWGDRMWQFLVTLLLAILYPGSLLLPGVFGLVLGLLVAVFGTLVGDWVDRNRRLKVVSQSLLIQNGLVALSAVGLAVMFGRDLDICGDVSLPVFIVLTSVVIILGSLANLATVANTIAKEKDWIVVIADKNEHTLAVLNANMRRIDLVCKLAAPATSGVILQFTGPLVTTIVVAVWNVVSFFAELGLIYLVYRWVPALAFKRFRRPSTFGTPEKPSTRKREGSEEMERGGKNGEEENLREYSPEEFRERFPEVFIELSPDRLIDEKKEVKVSSQRKSHRRLSSITSPSLTPRAFCRHILTPYITLRDGWSIYIHQEVALAGFALASLYLTVLGFSGVTATYFLTQGLPNALIGAAQGFGAIIGVSGTVAYPFIRARFGTVRTGLYGISCQLMMLMFCAAAVLVPAQRVVNPDDSYYAAHCPADSGPSNLSIPLCDFPTPSISSLIPTPSPSHPPSFLITPTSVTSPLHTSSPSPTPGSGDGEDLFSGSESVTGSSPPLMTSTLSLPCTTSTPSPPSDDPPSTLSVDSPWTLRRATPLILMIAGVVGARFGLWIFDLSIQQLVQETVAEEYRGVVGGVMNAMNSIMDMLHYVMVIVAPRPEHFTILTLISVGMVTLGAVLYAIYLRRVRGHFFHSFNQYYNFCRKSKGYNISAKSDQPVGNGDVQEDGKEVEVGKDVQIMTRVVRKMRETSV